MVGSGLICEAGVFWTRDACCVSVAVALLAAAVCVSSNGSIGLTIPVTVVVSGQKASAR